MTDITATDPTTAVHSATYEVTGMSCAHCVMAVRDELRTIPGVRGVDVDLATGAVVVGSDSPLDRAAVAAAIDEAGYVLAAPDPGSPA
jgi:copper chaperone